MATLPTVEVVIDNFGRNDNFGRRVFCVVVPATTYSDGYVGANWRTYDLTGKCIGSGFSLGVRQTGTSSIPMAMTNARRAARRWLDKQHSKELAANITMTRAV